MWGGNASLALGDVIDEPIMTNRTILHKQNTKRQLLKSTLADLESSAAKLN